MDIQCRVCKKGEDELRLRKCPICFKHHCEDHSVQRSGVYFCSRECADYFFFAEPDD